MENRRINRPRRLAVIVYAVLAAAFYFGIVWTTYRAITWARRTHAQVMEMRLTDSAGMV